MALLNADLCPEVLNDVVLEQLRQHFRIRTIQDFLETDRDLIASELSIAAAAVSKIRRSIFDKLSVRATNLGEVVASGHHPERKPIPTMLKDLVSAKFQLGHWAFLGGSEFKYYPGKKH